MKKKFYGRFSLNDYHEKLIFAKGTQEPLGILVDYDVALKGKDYISHFKGVNIRVKEDQFLRLLPFSLSDSHSFYKLKDYLSFWNTDWQKAKFQEGRKSYNLFPQSIDLLSPDTTVLCLTKRLPFDTLSPSSQKKPEDKDIEGHWTFSLKISKYDYAYFQASHTLEDLLNKNSKILHDKNIMDKIAYNTSPEGLKKLGYASCEGKDKKLLSEGCFCLKDR